MFLIEHNDVCLLYLGWHSNMPAIICNMWSADSVYGQPKHASRCTVFYVHHCYYYYCRICVLSSSLCLKQGAHLPEFKENSVWVVWLKLAFDLLSACESKGEAMSLPILLLSSSLNSGSREALATLTSKFCRSSKHLLHARALRLFIDRVKMSRCPRFIVT